MVSNNEITEDELSGRVMSIALAKTVIRENSDVLYGIFSIIKFSGFFPPRDFLNTFFRQGSDPCDQDARMAGWVPFELTAAEYQSVFDWWLSIYPDARVDTLSACHWDEWCTEIIEQD